MRGFLIAAMAAALMMTPAIADAATVTVFAPGLVGTSLQTLIDGWSAKSGNKVTVIGGTVGDVVKAVNGGTPGDLVILPSDNLAKLTAPLKPGTQRKVGQVAFGVSVKAGAAHPDISTAAKFRAALQGRRVGFNDPAGGSLAGVMIGKLFAAPDYAGVKKVPLKGNAALTLPQADGPDLVLGVVPEALAAKGVEVVGLVPAGIDLQIQLSAAVTAKAAAPDVAASLLSYITTPEAAAVWKKGGIVLSGP